MGYLLSSRVFSPSSSFLHHFACGITPNQQCGLLCEGAGMGGGRGGRSAPDLELQAQLTGAHLYMFLAVRNRICPALPFLSSASKLRRGGWYSKCVIRVCSDTMKRVGRGRGLQNAHNASTSPQEPLRAASLLFTQNGPPGSLQRAGGKVRRQDK
jgi:hypothetical protein